MNDSRSPLAPGMAFESPPSLHLAGNYRALMRRHAQGLGEPMRGALEQAAELIDQQRVVIERLEGLYETALRREGVLLGQLSMVRHLLTDAGQDGITEVLRLIK